MSFLELCHSSTNLTSTKQDHASNSNIASATKSNTNIRISCDDDDDDEPYVAPEPKPLTARRESILVGRRGSIIVVPDSLKSAAEAVTRKAMLENLELRGSSYKLQVGMTEREVDSTAPSITLDGSFLNLGPGGGGGNTGSRTPGTRSYRGSSVNIPSLNIEGEEYHEEDEDTDNQDIAANGSEQEEDKFNALVKGSMLGTQSRGASRAGSRVSLQMGASRETLFHPDDHRPRKQHAIFMPGDFWTNYMKERIDGLSSNTILLCEGRKPEIIREKVKICDLVETEKIAKRVFNLEKTISEKILDMQKLHVEKIPLESEIENLKKQIDAANKVAASLIELRSKLIKVRDAHILQQRAASLGSRLFSNSMMLSNTNVSANMSGSRLLFTGGNGGGAASSNVNLLNRSNADIFRSMK